MFFRLKEKLAILVLVTVIYMKLAIIFASLFYFFEKLASYWRLMNQPEIVIQSQGLSSHNKTAILKFKVLHLTINPKKKFKFLTRMMVYRWDDVRFSQGCITRLVLFRTSCVTQI